MLRAGDLHIVIVIIYISVKNILLDEILAEECCSFRILRAALFLIYDALTISAELTLYHINHSVDAVVHIVRDFLCPYHMSLYRDRHLYLLTLLLNGKRDIADRVLCEHLLKL